MFYYSQRADNWKIIWTRNCWLLACLQRTQGRMGEDDISQSTKQNKGQKSKDETEHLKKKKSYLTQDFKLSIIASTNKEISIFCPEGLKINKASKHIFPFPQTLFFCVYVYKFNPLTPRMPCWLQPEGRSWGKRVNAISRMRKDQQ